MPDYRKKEGCLTLVNANILHLLTMWFKSYGYFFSSTEIRSPF